MVNTTEQKEDMSTIKVSPQEAFQHFQTQFFSVRKEICVVKNSKDTFGT